MNMNARKVIEGEVPAPEQLQLVPDQPLDLEQGFLTLADLAHEDVPAAPKQLEDSIRRFGLLQPILVRQTVRTPKVEGEPYFHHDIVDGRRRLWVLRKLQVEEFPVVVAETDLAIADVATLAANATRTDNPIAEYEAISRLLHKGASQKEIAGATGMSVQTIKKRQRLLALNPDLTDGFKTGRIAASVAEEAAKLPAPMQRALVETLFANGKVTASDVHEQKLARNQSAVTTSLFDADAYETTNEPSATPNDDDPLEYLLAEEIQSIISRLTPFAKSVNPDLQGLLERAGNSLIDIAMMIADTKHMRQGDGDPRYKSDAEIAALPKEKKWNPDHTIFDQGSEGSSVGYAGRYFADMATDQAEDEGAYVRNPSFVYTVEPISQQHLEALAAEEMARKQRLADELDLEIKDGMIVEKTVIEVKPEDLGATAKDYGIAEGETVPVTITRAARKPRVKKEKERQVEDEGDDFLKGVIE